MKINKDYRKDLGLFILYFTIFIGFFIYNFNLPNSILYCCDGIIIFLLLILLRDILKTLRKRQIFLLFLVIVSLVLCGSFTALIYDFNIPRWLWSLRNWGRFFAYFIITVALFDKEECDKVCNSLIKLYHINFYIVLIQFLFFNSLYTQDSLNGLFGRDTSSVHITVTCIVIAIVVSRYFSKQISLRGLVFTLGEVFFIACIAELRAIPVIIIIIFCAAFFTTYRLTRQIFIKIIASIFLGAILIIVISYILQYLYPGSAIQYSLSGIIQAASTKGGYGYSGGVDRLTFISVINKEIDRFSRDWLFGIGIGNAEYSSVSSLISPFYKQYGNKLAYLNFSSSVIYIETGIVGLILYSYIFCLVFFMFYNRIRKKIKIHSNSFNQYYDIFGCLIAVINLFYICEDKIL